MDRERGGCDQRHVSRADNVFYLWKGAWSHQTDKNNRVSAIQKNVNPVLNRLTNTHGIAINALE
jgi:hypothetical protein